jgi:pyridoxal phosphate enzyme (YggS family)
VGAGGSGPEATFPRLGAPAHPPPFRMLASVRPGPDQIAANVGTIQERLGEAAAAADRSPDDVRLVAVSKTVAIDAIGAALDAGVTDLGENYVTELREKRPALADRTARWHYIGAVRSGTAHHVADLADVVHTLAGERSARRLAGRAARAGRRLDAMIAIDFTGQRAGIDPGDAPETAALLRTLEGIRLCGLMTIAPLEGSPEDARPWFRRLREIRDRLRERDPDVLELSMGMSLDYEVAVREGATMVRIGSAVFGARTP